MILIHIIYQPSPFGNRFPTVLHGRSKKKRTFRVHRPAAERISCKQRAAEKFAGVCLNPGAADHTMDVQREVSKRERNTAK